MVLRLGSPRRFPSVAIRARKTPPLRPLPRVQPSSLSNEAPALQVRENFQISVFLSFTYNDICHLSLSGSTCGTFDSTQRTSCIAVGTDCLVHSCSKISNILACPSRPPGRVDLEVRDYPPGMYCSSNSTTRYAGLAKTRPRSWPALLLDEPLAAIKMYAPSQS